MASALSFGKIGAWSGMIDSMIEGLYAGLVNDMDIMPPGRAREAMHRHKISEEDFVHSALSPPGSVDSLTNGPLTPGMVNSPPDTGGDDGSGDSSSGSLKRKLAKKDLKVCSICGDVALGCNFDAISCESCKAFFRRNALKDKKTKCVFSGNCNIDVNTRKFCPHCRLLKCFAVGMKKELILGDAERQKRRQKVERNRAMKGKPAKRARLSNEDAQSSIGSPPAMSPLPDASTLLPTPSHSPVSSPAQPTDINIKVETTTIAYSPIAHHSPVTNNTALPNGITNGIADDLAAHGLPNGMLPNVLTPTFSQTVLPPQTTVLPEQTLIEPAIAATCTVETPLPPTPRSSPSPSASVSSHQSTGAQSYCNLLSSVTYLPMPDPGDPQSSLLDSNGHRQLSVEENHILTELMQIYDLSFTVDLEPIVHIKQLDPTLNQLVNQSSITVLRIIKFAKRLEEFVSLPQECQIGILKGTWIHILLLRSVSMYDCERDLWVTPRVAIPTEILKNATGYVQLHDDHVNYCKSIKNMVKEDITLISIMVVIVLFSPEGQHVTLRGLISNVQDKYLVLLKHYIEYKYGYTKAAEMYSLLISKMKELKELAEVHGKYLLDVNPREIEPIMLEILDLK